MRTFLVVTLYTVMVAALDLGGAVWTSLRTAHAAKATATAHAASHAPAKIGHPVREAETIPSHT